MITHEYTVWVDTPYEKRAMNLRAVSPVAAIEMVLEKTNISPQAITKTLVRTIPNSAKELRA